MHLSSHINTFSLIYRRKTYKYINFLFQLKYLIFLIFRVEITDPYRADFPNRFQFFSVLTNDPTNLPVLPSNLPSTDASQAPNNHYLFDYIKDNLTIHSNILSNNFFWNNANSINLPYLPYFSNCKVF